ncbi:cytochrome c oxidase copper chaperone COX17 [Brevipalpus obovatus]|uniref:cytochrome c oxidase copper chaperone COX17 n=1 Tax=Brevipalpus obovatus TaxID=246614 RepID=UPI003D9ED1C4
MMANVESQSGNKGDKKSATDGEKKLKPCCACPETKRARDECIIERGEEHCQDLIEAHKKCMRDLGFRI